MSTYIECGEKYRLHHIARLRPIKPKSALVFGGALDIGLNELLRSRDLDLAKAVFKEAWARPTINDQIIDIEQNDAILYSKADWDVRLGESPWKSLLAKGMLMLDAYAIEALPQFKQVLAVQHPISMFNSDGDEIRGTLDFIVEMQDGRIVLMDNKSTSKPYEQDAASKSPQLSLYYHVEKDKFKLDAIGFVTMNKYINFQAIKICSVCGHDGSKGQHRSCNNKINKRCGGSWNISYFPKCIISVIINNTVQKVIHDTLDMFDKANHGIANGIFEKNDASCYSKFGPCQNIGLCKHGSMHNLKYFPK